MRGLTRSVMARMVPPFPAPSRPSNTHHDALPFGFHPGLKVAKLGLEPAQLLLVFFALQFRVTLVFLPLVFCHDLPPLYSFQINGLITSTHLLHLLRSLTGEQHHHRTRLGPIAVSGNRRSGLPRDNVQGRVEPCIDPSTPGIRAAIAHRRQLEFKRLPIGIQDQVNEESFLRHLAR